MEQRFYLIIVEGEKEGEKIPITSETFTIGRREKNDLVFSDPRVSGYHAEITKVKESWILKDLGSTNGTFLDGARIDEVPLEHGDIFSIGVIKIKFVDSQKEELKAGSEDKITKVDKALLEKTQKKISLLPFFVLIVLLIGAGIFVFFNLKGKETQGVNAPLMKPIPGNILDANLASFEGRGNVEWQKDKGTIPFSIEPGISRSGKRAAFIEVEKKGYGILTLKNNLKVPYSGGVNAGFFVKIDGEDAAICMHLLLFDEKGILIQRVPSPWVVGSTKQAFEKVSFNVPLKPICTSWNLEIIALGEKGSVSLDDVFVVPKEGITSNRIKIKDYPSSFVLYSCSKFNIIQKETPVILNLGPFIMPVGDSVEEDIDDSTILFAKSKDNRDKVFSLDWTNITFNTKIETKEDGFYVNWIKNKDFGLLYLGWEVLSSASINVLKGNRLLIRNGEENIVLGFEKKIEPKELKTKQGKTIYYIPFPEGKLWVKVGFRKDIALSTELLIKAHDEEAKGRFGEAIISLKRIIEEIPYNPKDVEEARKIYARIFDKGQIELNKLKSIFEKAKVFASKDEIERVVQEGKAFIAKYSGEDSLIKDAEELLKQAEGILNEIRKEEIDKEVERLKGIAEAVGEESLILKKLIEDYIKRNFKTSIERKEQGR